MRAEIGNTSASGSPSSLAIESACTVRAWLSRSTLLTAIATGTLARAQRLGDPAVPPAADALLAVDDEQRRVGLGQLGLDAPLHPRGERVARALHARQVGQDELELVRRP